MEALGCHHIRFKGSYYTCGNPDGDNPSAITVYLDDYLRTIDYTRDIEQNNINADIITLVEFFEKCPFFDAVKKICEWIDLDYYHDFSEDLPESIKLTKLLVDMSSGDMNDQSEPPLKPISESILSYYCPYVNDLFAEDHVSYSTQRAFEIGYDEQTNRITIPIRDETGTLTGVKARYFYRDVPPNELKYLYIEPTNRSQILYGLYMTYEYIQHERCVFVGESEKSVQQLWDMGYRNAVATGGKKISNGQIEKLSRLCSDIVFLFDKDVDASEINEIANRFVDGITIYAVIDDCGILEEKESPTDDPQKFRQLIKQCKKRIR